MNCHHKNLALIVWGLMGITVHAQGTLDLNERIVPMQAPFNMPMLKRPSFPEADFSIQDYGAVADGKTPNTQAFAQAIAACHDAGGGRVVVPAGQWYTGPIHLRSNVNLYLSEGAEIVFSDRFEDYLPPVLVRVGGIEIYNYSPLIYARDCENIAITGPGKLNGNAEAWWAWSRKETRAFFEMGAQGVPVEERIFGTEEAAIRPSFIVPFNCKNVLLEGFSIGSGPNWTIHPIYCENVIIRRVNVTTDGPNNDGIDPDSCRNLLIEHCVFDTGDDCVVLKSGYNEDGWRVGKPTENVVMRFCQSKRGHGGLVIGSEMSGDVRNVYMHDCHFEGTERAIRIKSKRGRGGIVENIWARGLICKDMQREVAIMNMAYSADTREAQNTKAPVFRDIHISRIMGEGAPVAIKINALPDSPVENIFFQDIFIKSQKGVQCNFAKNVSFVHAMIAPQAGPTFQLGHCQDITLLDCGASPGTDVFLDVTDTECRNIQICESDLTDAQTPVSLAEGADPETVIFKNVRGVKP